ncbi:MAG TPA: hypothetical protein VHO27_15610 [Angustibacter sp.]|nr:hypothetical protein [Angustibacter sp.]
MRLSHRGKIALNSVLALATVGVVLAVVLGWKSATQPFRPAACEATAAGTTFQVSPEQMANAATIAGIAVKRHLPARAATIALATARQESKFINVTYGDRDSLGLFQQRPSQGWGTAAQVQDPVHATNAFYDALVKVHGYQSMEITKVAQKVQRSAYPEAYANHEPEGRVLASALTGHSTAALTCRLDDSFRPGGTAGLRRFEQALPREQAAVTTTRLAGVPGVRLAATDPTFAWSLAQWSVGSAERFGVTRVYVAGRVWDHRKPDDGWRASSDGGRGVVVLFTDAALPRP